MSDPWYDELLLDFELFNLLYVFRKFQSRINFDDDIYIYIFFFLGGEVVYDITSRKKIIYIMYE